MNVPKSVLLVCLGNICRSPSAEAVLRQKITQKNLDIVLDSAGTAGYHIGEKPDNRAITVGGKLGYDLSQLRARQIQWEDFYRFDIIFAMDKNNFNDLQKLQRKAQDFHLNQPIGTLLAFDTVDIADPYYGNLDDFRQMFVQIQKTADNWISIWQNNNQNLTKL